MRKNLRFLLFGMAALSILSTTSCKTGRLPEKRQVETKAPQESESEETSEDKTDFDIQNEKKTEVEDAKTGEYPVGKMRGGVYTNEFFGVKFNAEDKDMVMTDKKDMNNDYISKGGDISDTDMIMEYIDSGSSFGEMYAGKGENFVMLVVEKKRPTMSDIEEYIDMLVESWELPAGSEDTEVEKSHENFLGEDRPIVTGPMEFFDKTMYMSMTILYSEDYVAEVMAVADTPSSSKEGLYLFEKIEAGEAKTETDVSQDTKLSKGLVENGIYTNKMLGMEFDAEENDFEFNALSEGFGPLLADNVDSMQYYMEHGGEVVDMWAEHKKDTYTKVGVNILIYPGSEEDYINEQIKGDKNREKGSTEFLGDMRPCINAEEYTNNTDKTTLYYTGIPIKVGEYLIRVEAYSTDKNIVSDALAAFKKIN